MRREGRTDSAQVRRERLFPAAAKSYQCGARCSSPEQRSPVRASRGLWEIQLKRQERLAAAFLARFLGGLLGLRFGLLGFFRSFLGRLLGRLLRRFLGRNLGCGLCRGLFPGFFRGFIFYHALGIATQLVVLFQPGQLIIFFKMVLLEIHAFLPWGHFLTRCSWHAAPAGDESLRPCDLLSHSNVDVKSSRGYVRQAFHGGPRTGREAVTRGTGGAAVVRKWGEARADPERPEDYCWVLPEVRLGGFLDFAELCTVRVSGAPPTV